MTAYSNEKGSSLVEVLGVMAIIATVVVVTYSGIAKANQKIKVSQAVQQVSNVVKSMRIQFSAFLPESATADQLVQAGVYEKKDVLDGTAVNVVGTEMDMIIAPYVENPYFVFIYKDIPVRACVDLMMGDWGNDPSSGLKEIIVNADHSFNFVWKKDLVSSVAGNTFTLLPDLDAVKIACTPESADTVSISWVYYF